MDLSSIRKRVTNNVRNTIRRLDDSTTLDERLGSAVRSVGSSYRQPVQNIRNNVSATKSFVNNGGVRSIGNSINNSYNNNYNKVANSSFVQNPIKLKAPSQSFYGSRMPIKLQNFADVTTAPQRRVAQGTLNVGKTLLGLTPEGVDYKQKQREGYGKLFEGTATPQEIRASTELITDASMDMTSPVAGIISGSKARSLIGRQGDDLTEQLRKVRAFSNVKDKAIRFFTSDKDAFIRQTAKPLTGEGNVYALGDLLSHKRLFKEYPDLRQVFVKFDPNLPNNTLGGYFENKNTIVLNPNSGKNVSTLLHEVQHAIQGIEDMARGSGTAQSRADALSRNIRLGKGSVDQNDITRAYNSSLGEIEANLTKDSIKLGNKELRGNQANVYQNYLDSMGVRPDDVLTNQGVRFSSKNTDPLIEEAKKYNSAEEFVKAQGDLVYHGTDANPFTEFSDSFLGKNKAEPAKLGHWFTDDQMYAGFHGDNVIEAKLNLSNPRIYTRKQWGLVDKKGNFGDLRKQLESAGYDGIRVLPSREKLGTQTVNNAGLWSVFDQSKIKTKSQLTDIYNQAQEPVLRVKPTGGELSNEAENLVKQEVDRLKAQVGGVDIIPTADGGYRQSNNPQWYKDIFNEQGRRPSEAQYRELAIKNLKTGEVDGMFNDPQALKYNNNILNKPLDDIDRQINAKPITEAEANKLTTKGGLKGLDVPETPQKAVKAPLRVMQPQPVPIDFGEPKTGIRAEFNKILNPIKNAPKQVQDTVQNWSNRVMTGRAKANEAIDQFASIESKDGWNFIRYMQDPDTPIKDFAPEKYTEEIKALRKYYNDIRQEGIANGLDIEYLDNYINQVWKETPKEVSEALAEYLKKGKALGKNPSFTKSKVFESYEVGRRAGLTPRYTHPAQLAAHYRYQLDKAIANRDLVKQLRGLGAIVPAEQAPTGWKTLDTQLIPDIDGFRAEPSLAKSLNNIFSLNDSNMFLKGGATTSRVMQQMTMSGGLPGTPMNAFTLGNMIKEFTAGRVKSPIQAFVTATRGTKATENYFKKNSEYVTKMAEQGIRSRSVRDYDKAYKNIFDTKGKTGVVRKVADIWNSTMEKPTFERFMPMLELNSFKDTYDFAIRKGMSEEQASKLAGDTAKAWGGVINNLSRSEDTSNALTSVFFAPTFRESMFNFWVNNLSAIKNIKDPAYRYNRRFLGGMLLSYAGYSLLNKALNGEYMSENKGGKEFALEIPADKLPEGWASDGKSWFIPMLPSVGTIPRRGLEMGGALMAGDVRTATQKAAGFLSQPLNLGGQLATNRNFFGDTIYNNSDTVGQKFGKLATYAAAEANHPYIGEPINILSGRKTPAEGATGALELPIYPSKSTERGEPTKFTQSDDAPTTALGRGGLLAQSAVANPIQTAKIINNGEQIRKIRKPNTGNPITSFFGSSTITERPVDLADLDQGNKNTQVDHILPKWLGGRENDSNYQILTNEDHAKKSELDRKLLAEYEAGQITRSGAINQIKQFNKSLTPIAKPKPIKNTVSASSNTTKDYTYNTPAPKDPLELEAYDSKILNEARGVFRDEKMSQEEKNSLIADMGYTPEDIELDVVGNSTVVERAIWVRDKLQQLPEDQHQAFLNSLYSARTISGDRILTSSVAKKLGISGYGSSGGSSKSKKPKAVLKGVKNTVKVGSLTPTKTSLPKFKLSTKRSRPIQLGTLTNTSNPVISASELKALANPTIKLTPYS